MDAYEEISRLEAEAGCELPALDHIAGGATLADRARRLLDCIEPPQDEVRAYLEEIAGRK